MEILGLVITGLIAFVLAAVGLFGLLSKGSIGQSIRGLFAMIPLGSPKLWAGIVLVIGLMAGGFTYGSELVSGLFGAGATATTLGSDVVSTTAPSLVNCQISSIAGTTSPTNGNWTFRADPNDKTHYYADLENYSNTGGGAGSINGTIVCDRSTNDIRQGQQASCEFVSDSFRSQTSTTDANTYYFVATATSKSAVSGMPWAQTAYLNDGAVATAASRQEVTTYVFAQDVASRTLGFLFTGPGGTTMSYLNDNNGGNVYINCDGKRVAYITVTKLAQVVE